MKTHLFVCFLFVGISNLFSQSSETPAISTVDTKNFPTIGEIIRLSPEIDDLIDKDAKIEVLADGFIWAEGPVWVNDEKEAIFYFPTFPVIQL